MGIEALTDFRHHDEHGDAQGQCQREMLTGGADDAGIGTHHQHCVVGHVARHAEDGRLEVLLVAGQVDEGYHLRKLCCFHMAAAED